jgi:dienelactone hydrolase
MCRAISWFLLIGLLGLAPVQGQDRKKEPPKRWPRDKAAAIVARYARAFDDAEREKLLAELREIDVDVPLADAKAFAQTVQRALVANGLKLKSGRFEHPRFPGSVIVSGNGGGLVLGLHGGGQGQGDGANAAGLYGGFAGRVGVGLFPTVLQKRNQEWDSYPEEQEYVYELVRAAKRTFAIDSTRVYCIGFSMGGCGSWVIGSQLADHFAAVVTGGGGPCTARFENFFTTPIHIYHGDRDDRSPVEANRSGAKALEGLKERYGPFDFVYREDPGVGHQWPAGAAKEQLDFAQSKKRDLFPRKVLWSPSVDWKRVFFWLKVDKPSEIGRGRSIFAEIKEGNEIHVTGSADGLSILLNDKLVDLKKPVKVVHNGSEAFHGEAPGSLVALLLSLDDKIDPACALWAKIDLK